MSKMDLRCSQCGAPLIAGGRYCGNCGAIMQGTDGESSTISESELAQPPMSMPPLVPAVLPDLPYQPYSVRKPKKGRGLLIGLLVGLVAVVVLCGVSVNMLAGSISKLSDMSTNSNVGTVVTPTSIASYGGAPAPLGEAFFTDDFMDNSNGWSVYAGQKASVALQKGGLLLHDADGTSMLAPVPLSDGWVDFQLDLTYTPSLGGSDDQAGVIFREQATPKGAGPVGYLLKIDNQGKYLIRKIVTPASASDPYGTYSDLGSGAMKTAPLAGVPIDVTLLMKKYTIVLYLNGSYQGSFTDPEWSFRWGSMSLFVENGSDGTSADALFKHLDVYPAPNVLPTN